MANVTGTTVNAYANALEWSCSSFDKNTVIIKNNHATNALKLKVLVLAHANGIEYPKVAEKELAAGVMELVNITAIYHSIYVAMKSSVTDAHATYQVDYLGGLQR